MMETRAYDTCSPNESSCTCYVTVGSQTKIRNTNVTTYMMAYYKQTKTTKINLIMLKSSPSWPDIFI